MHKEKKVTKKDILFLDPMFEINSRASAKKEIQFLRKCISTSSEKEILDAAEVKLGENYPEPIVDLKISRERALNAFKSLS